MFRRGDTPHSTMAKRKRTKGQTTQWPKEKGQKDKQHNGQKKKDKRTDSTIVKRKRTNNILYNTIQKTKDRATRTPLTICGELCIFRL